MATKCVPCLGTAVKTVIVEAFPELEKQVALFLDCEEEGEVRGCKGKKGKNEYQLHTSACMKRQGIHDFKDAPAAMRRCSAEWKARKVE